MKDLYTVQEFSELSGVETTKLRYWDDIGLFSPTKRDPENNYRYYSLAQLLALNFVTVMSDLGIPLKTIAKLRKKRTPAELLKLLEKHEMEMDMEMRKLRLRYSIIHTRRELINYGMRADENEIAIMHRDNKALILWPRNEYQEGDTFIDPLAAFINKIGIHHINLSFPVGGYWDDIDSFIKTPTQPDHFITIDPTGMEIRKAGDYLVGFARGYYSEFNDLPERISAYIKKNAVSVHGPAYIMYLNDEICTEDPSQYLAQFCVAVSKHKHKG